MFIFLQVASFWQRKNC